MATITRAQSSEQVLVVLTRAVQDLSLARDAEDVQRIVRSAARRLVDADGATFILRDGDTCHYVDEDAVGPLWKGRRFPLKACISGWAILHRQHVAIEDVYLDDRIPKTAYRPTFVQSLLMTPIRGSDPIGAIGVYWARRHRATEREIGLARALADSTAVALQHVTTLEELGRERERSTTDQLTGLVNRRGWNVALAQRLESGALPISIAALDLDRFKEINDELGHAAGDEVLCLVADGWRTALRPGDVVARLGGDEFAVLFARCTPAQARSLAERLRRVASQWSGVSVGVATSRDGEPATDVLARADSALYAAKNAGRDRVAVAD